jgi:hypothetical protein
MACLVLLLVSIGCAHDGPFRPEEYGTDQPFILGPPRILTANRGVDASPAVLPDNSAFIYSFDSWYEPGDMCFGIIPVGQARVTRELCPLSDSLSFDRFALAAVSSSNRVALHLARSNPFSVGPYYSAVVIAPMTDIRDTSEIIPVPIRTPDGVLHDTIAKLTRLGWLRGDTLAILLSNRIYLVDTRDPARTITWLDTPGPVADFDVDGTRLFVSLIGATQLFRFDLTNRQLLPVHDFGSAGSIGPIQVAGNRAAALAGAGIYLADLDSHTQSPISDFGLLISQIALAESGPDLVAQAQYPFQAGVDLVAFRIP